MIGFAAFVRNGWVYIAAVLEALIALERYVEFLGRQRDQVRVTLPLCGVLAVVAGCLYVYRSRLQLGGASAWRFSRMTRVIAAVLLVVVPAASALAMHYTLRTRSYRLRVAVAQFKNEGPQVRPVHQVIRAHLSTTLGKYRDLKLTTPALSLSDDIQDVRAALTQNDVTADAIVWGWYAITPGKATMNVRLDAIDRKRAESAEMQRFIECTPHDLDENIAARRIAEELRVALLFALGQNRLRDGAVDSAIESLQTASDRADALSVDESNFQEMVVNINALLSQLLRAAGSEERARVALGRIQAIAGRRRAIVTAEVAPTKIEMSATAPADRVLYAANIKIAMLLRDKDPQSARRVYREALAVSPPPTASIVSDRADIERQLYIQPRPAQLF
jgi:hypothetical protein